METKKEIEGKRAGASKGARTFDAAYGFSFSVGLGLVLFIGGLVVSLALGLGPGTGLIFGIPLLLAGLALPVFMMRDTFKANVIEAPCPYCGERIKTTDATLKLNCPKCRKPIAIQDAKFVAID